MSEVPAPPAPAPSATAATPRRRGGAPLVGVLATVALAAAAWAGWRAWQLEHGAEREIAAARSADVEAAGRLAHVERELEQARSRLDALERKLTDAEAVNRSLREEVLGIGERASIVEDAVANLAEKRTGGATALRLNEIEFLLRLGQERLQLFGDRRAAGAALRLADAELARLDDAALVGVRQTLAAEVAALADPQADAPGRALAALDRALAALPQLPARPRGPPPATAAAADAGFFARAASVLGQYVRIRRLDPNDTALASPLNLDATRAAAALELLLAKSALTLGDRARYRAVTERARERVAGAFDRDDARVRATLAALDEALALPAEAPPPELGRALAELVNLRATRTLAEDVAPAPTPALAPTPTPAPSPPGGDGTP